MSKKPELLTIQEALALQLNEIINNANELKRIYNKVPLGKIGEVNSGHDAFCEFLRTSCNLVTQSKKLLDKANYDAQRYKAGAGVTTKEIETKKTNQDAFRKLLIKEFEEGCDSDPIGLKEPANGPEDQRQNRDAGKKTTQLEVVQLTSLDGILQQTEGTFEGFNCSVISIDPGVTFITYDSDRKSSVRGLRAPNGKMLTVKVGEPQVAFRDVVSNELQILQTGVETIAIPFENILLVKKQKTLDSYVSNQKTKVPVWPRASIDLVKPKKDGPENKQITASIDSTDRIQTSSRLVAALSKDRKKVVLLNPEPTEQKPFEVAFNEVRVFSLYSINSEKRKGESVLFVSEKEGSLYHFISSDPLKAEKPAKLLQIAGLLDVFYVSDRLFVLRSDKQKLVVELYKVTVGDSETPLFKLGSPEKFAEFAIEGDLASADVRFGIVGELANPAEATVLVFVGNQVLKYSCKSQQTEKLLLFNQAFTLNTLIPHADQLECITFILTATITKVTDIEVHVVSLRFTSFKGVAYDFTEFDDEEMMEEGGEIEY